MSQKNAGPLPIVAGGSPHDAFVVINKPSGLLSTPGRGAETNPAKADCVAARVQAMFPHATGPLIVHRLDMDTSGLMVLGLTPEAQRTLSRQFEKRTVTKHYIALLAGHHDHLMPGAIGTIVLPLRLDLDNRPCQIVDLLQGRHAITRYTILGRELHGGVGVSPASVTRISFMPITGRSHQLRVHAAHPNGLNAPIMGDPLYGDSSVAPRLMLHAESLAFDSPTAAQRIEVHCDAPF